MLELDKITPEMRKAGIKAAHEWEWADDLKFGENFVAAIYRAMRDAKIKGEEHVIA